MGQFRARFIAIGVAAAAAAGAAFADTARDGLLMPELRYVTILGGYGLGDKAGAADGKADLSDSFIVSGSAGLRHEFENGATLRTEFEGVYQPFRDVDSRTDLYSVLLNAWYEFENGGKIRPYIGGGIGVGMADAGGFERDVGLAYQLGGGVEANIFEDGSAYLGAGYRYYGFRTDIAGSKATLNGHRLLLYMGFRF